MASTEVSEDLLQSAVGTEKLGFYRKTSAQTFKMVHEIGPDLQDSTRIDSFEIGPSFEKTVIRLQSVLDLSQVRKGASTAFIASVRRRKCRALVAKVNALPTAVVDDNWAMATHAIYVDLIKLIDEIQVAKDEANAREILRQLRDTLTNSDWEKYRLEKCRQTAKAILTELSVAVDVTLEQTIKSADLLESQGFCVIGIPITDE